MSSLWCRAYVSALWFLTIVLLLLGDSRVWADRPILSDDEQEEVNRAIDKGVKYLIENQNPDGTFGPGTHKVGYCSLAGLALTECGVPIKDKSVQWAATHVRANAAKLTNTYELALAIMFLDALGDPKDRTIIQTFALRLIAGQKPSGGWSYTNPVLDPATAPNLYQILKALPTIVPPRSPGDGGAPAPAPAKKPMKIPAVLPANTVLPVLQNPNVFANYVEPEKGDSDNSCTQFAMLGLWIAKRHDVPIERTVRLFLSRFRKTQNDNGGWGYRSGAGGSPSMICVGLMALAIGFGAGLDGGAGEPADRKVDEKTTVLMPRAGWCIRMLEGSAKDSEEPTEKPVDQDKMVKGFTLLNKSIGTPVGRMKDLPMQSLYFLWSVERICMLFNLRNVGEKEWYRWGAEILVANQDDDGGWTKEGGFHGQTPVLNTTLALLFLKRANLTSDLTRKLPDVSSEIVKNVTPPPPSVKPPEPETVAATPEPAPTPPPVEETKLPEPTPVAAAPEPEEPKSNKKVLGLILALLAIMLLIGAAAAFVYLKKDKEEEDRPRKKSKKGKNSEKRRKASDE